MSDRQPTSAGAPPTALGAAPADEPGQELTPERHSFQPSKPIEYLDGVLKVLVVAALFAELAVMFGNIVLTDVFSHPLLWDSELATLPLMTMTYIAGALAYGRGEILAVERFLRFIPARLRRGAKSLGDVGVLVFGVATIAGSVPYLQSEWSDRSPILGIPTTWYVLPLPLAALVFIVYAIDRLRTTQRRQALLGVGAALTIALLFVAVQWGGSTLGIDPTPVLTILAFAILLTLSVPMVVVFTLVPLIYLTISAHVAVEIIPANLYTAADDPLFLAIPFFILAGYLLGRGGLSQGLIGFLDRLIGRFRGGMLQVATVSMYLFSGLSGSKLADVAAVGAGLESQVAERGYRRERLAAVLSVSAVMGETVPPSTAMIVLGSITTLSIGALFIGGLVPAATLALVIMIVTYVLERRTRWSRAPGRGSPATAKEWLLSAIGAMPALLVITIIVGSIALGAATPTDASAIAAVVGMLLVLVRHRGSSLRVIWDVAVRAAVMVGTIQLVISAASMISYTLTVGQGDLTIQNWFGDLHSRLLFLLVSLVVLPVFGAVLEGLPAIILFGPILLPVATAYGVNGLQYGIVIILSIGLGSFAPPMGVGYLFACRVCNSRERPTARALVPYLIAGWLGILAIALVPPITLSLPGWLSLT